MNLFPVSTPDQSLPTVDWRKLVEHTEAGQAVEPTDTAYERFRVHRHEFMAVLDASALLEKTNAA